MFFLIVGFIGQGLVAALLWGHVIQAGEAIVSPATVLAAAASLLALHLLARATAQGVLLYREYRAIGPIPYRDFDVLASRYMAGVKPDRETYARLGLNG